jgi:hypothetical protein
VGNFLEIKCHIIVREFKNIRLSFLSKLKLEYSKINPTFVKIILTKSNDMKNFFITISAIFIAMILSISFSCNKNDVIANPTQRIDSFKKAYEKSYPGYYIHSYSKLNQTCCGTTWVIDTVTDSFRIYTFEFNTLVTSAFGGSWGGLHGDSLSNATSDTLRYGESRGGSTRNGYGRLQIMPKLKTIRWSQYTFYSSPNSYEGFYRIE